MSQRETHTLVTRPESFRLGETVGEIVVSTRAEVIEAVRMLACQARRCLHVFSFDLEPAVYDQLKFIDCVSELARSSPRAEIRIIIQDSGRIVRDGHRLIPLIHRLPSRLSIRRLNVEAGPLPEAWIAADEDGYLYRPNGEFYEGVADFHCPLRVAELVNRFKDLWEQSHLDPELRRLSV